MFSVVKFKSDSSVQLALPQGVWLFSKFCTYGESPHLPEQNDTSHDMVSLKSNYFGGTPTGGVVVFENVYTNVTPSSARRK